MAILNQQVIFLFTKLENRREEQVLSKGLVPVGERKMWRKGEGG
jgi:hypothetical protein